MDTDFAITCSLVRRRRPPIQFLFIGPYLCSTLPLAPPHGDALALRYPSPPSGWNVTSIRLLNEHVVRTKKNAGNGLHVPGAARVSARGPRGRHRDRGHGGRNQTGRRDRRERVSSRERRRFPYPISGWGNCRGSERSTVPDPNCVR